MTRAELLAAVRWNPMYRPEWNETPWAYVEAGLVKPNKARRLGKLHDSGRSFQAYLGVQHAEPSGAWRPDAPYCRFFVSLWHRGRVVVLQTHPTLEAAFDQLWAFYQRLPARAPTPARRLHP